MSTSDEIMGFDPANDDARSPQGGKVKKMYQKLKERGKDDAAEELRHAADLRDQLQLVESHPEFDPRHDDWKTTSKGEIARVYDWLRENGHKQEAEELRDMDSVRQQQHRVDELKNQHPIPRRGE
jgi:bacterioferritin (cytochrome b1)